MHSGELEIKEREKVTGLHKGDCVFIRKDFSVQLTKPAYKGEQFKAIFQPPRHRKPVRVHDSLFQFRHPAYGRAAGVEDDGRIVGCTFFDRGGITIGDGVFIAPKVNLITINHDPNPDNRSATYGRPIVIGDKVWAAIRLSS